MAARSFVIQLQPGVGQAILPDHRKMLPGQQYVVDAETFGKLSLGARQNVIKVITVNLDDSNTGSATASGSFVPAQVSTGINAQAVGSGLSWLNYLTTTSTGTSTFTIAGFAAQGFDPGGTAGAGAGIGLPNGTLNGSASNQTVVGPEGNRYTLVYNNCGVTISGGWVTTWLDENNRYITISGATVSGSYVVKADGLGTPYTISANTSLAGVNGNVTTVGTKQGAFAGITLASIPNGNYGFILIEGTHPSVAVPSGTAAGATLGVDFTTNNGVCKAVSPQAVNVSSAGVVTGSAQANNVFGTALTAAVSGTGTGQYFSAVEVRSRRVKKPYVRVLNKN